MEILITYGHREEDLASLPIRDLALFVLEREGKPINTEVSISFVDDTAMAELNERFRGMEGPTDVLSFECDNIDDDITAADGPSCPVYELGDIIVAPTSRRVRAPSSATPSSRKCRCSSFTGFCTCAATITSWTRRPRSWRPRARAAHGLGRARPARCLREPLSA